MITVNIKTVEKGPDKYYSYSEMVAEAGVYQCLAKSLLNDRIIVTMRGAFQICDGEFSSLSPVWERSVFRFKKINEKIVVEFAGS